MPTLHMRGVYYVGHADGDLVVRPISTHVGFTVLDSIFLALSIVHPYVRGVYDSTKRKNNWRSSPSLRAWGLLNIEWQVTGTDRSISTYVRFMSWIMSILIRITVHPHTCGVYSSMLQSRAAFCGPSPRARGLRPAQRWSCHPHPHARRVYDPEWPCRLRQDRSIPTCVGFTVVSARTFRSFPGPSPHTWGLRWWWSRPPGHPPVHPHIRGVYDLPRGRGWGGNRSIPTYVGFTIESSELEQGSNGPSPHTWGLP